MVNYSQFADSFVSEVAVVCLLSIFHKEKELWSGWSSSCLVLSLESLREHRGGSIEVGRVLPDQTWEGWDGGKAGAREGLLCWAAAESLAGWLCSASLRN